MPSPTPKKIEDLLDWKRANEYSIKNHHVVKVLREVFGSHEALFRSFTEEISASEKFRADLAASLGSEISARPKVAKRWIMFLKPRINVLEFWSGMFAAFAAIYGLASTLFTLLSAATGKGSPTAILVWFVVVSVFLLGAKFYVDKRAFWYKFVVAHLDAISHGL